MIKETGPGAFVQDFTATQGLKAEYKVRIHSENI